MVPGLVAAIRERFGRIDVIEYAPIDGAVGFTAARDLTADQLAGYLELLTLTPIALVQEVLPEMIERGAGAILVGAGANAVHPTPNLSGPVPAMAATRNYLHALHGEVAAQGVYVGMLAVTAMIARSAPHQALQSGALTIDLPEGVELPVVDPDELADLWWHARQDRAAVELLHPAR